MKILNLAQTQQIAGGDISIQTQGKTLLVSDEGISAACAQALPSLVTSTFGIAGLTQSPCSNSELMTFQQRYAQAATNAFNGERTFQHKKRIDFSKMMVRR